MGIGYLNTWSSKSQCELLHRCEYTPQEWEPSLLTGITNIWNDDILIYSLMLATSVVGRTRHDETCKNRDKRRDIIFIARIVKGAANKRGQQEGQLRGANVRG